MDIIEERGSAQARRLALVEPTSIRPLVYKKKVSRVAQIIKYPRERVADRSQCSG